MIDTILKRLQALSSNPKWTVVFAHIRNNRSYKKKIHRRDYVSADTASTFRNMSTQQCVRFIDNCFNDLTVHSGLTAEVIKDKSILEIGHGENIGPALKFMLAGAARVVCLDKFYAARDSVHEANIYKKMREELNDKGKILFDDLVRFKEDDGFEVNTDKIVYHYGCDIAEANKLLGSASFDIIVSNAVLEHVGNLDGAFRAMDKLLKQDGLMVHVIDFKDHGMFTSLKSHPLTFLTIPQIVFRFMTFHSGQPNRKLIDYYRTKMRKLHYDYTIFIEQVVCTPEQETGVKTSLAPNMKVDENTGVVTLRTYKERLQKDIDYTDSNLLLIDAIRPHLTGKLKKMTNEDLLGAAILLVGRKTAKSAKK